MMYFGRSPASKVGAVSYVFPEGDMGGEELTPHQLLLLKKMTLPPPHIYLGTQKA